MGAMAEFLTSVKQQIYVFVPTVTLVAVFSNYIYLHLSLLYNVRLLFCGSSSL